MANINICPQDGALHSLHFIRCIVSKYQYLPSGRFILPDDSYSQTPKRLSLNIYTRKQCHIRPVNAIVLYKFIHAQNKELLAEGTQLKSKQVLWADKVNILCMVWLLTHFLKLFYCTIWFVAMMHGFCKIF